MNSKIRILLADDDVEDRFIMQDAFKEFGMPEIILFAEDGEKVIARLNEITDHQDLPNLIVLDLNMPRLNGTQTLKLIKNDSRYQAIPVIIFSTSLNELEMEECMLAGASSYIIKPNTFEECIATARRFYNFCLDPSIMAEM